MAGGSLWADTVNKYLYLYGPEKYNWTTFPSSTYELWYYDALHDEWDSKQEGMPIYCRCLSVQALLLRIKGRHTTYGGWISNATQYGTLGDEIYQSSLISYDIVEDVRQNVTFYDSTPRAEGVMFIQLRVRHAHLFWRRPTSFKWFLYWGTNLRPQTRVL